ncbi:MAG: VOC family protein [Hyphomicrobiaceae bacterium]
MFRQACARQEALSNAWELPNAGQIGIVVKDPLAASAHWGARLGIRSWYRPRLTECRTWASGVPLDQKFEIVIGYSQRTQIELFSVTGLDQGFFDAPSFNSLPEVHHVGYFVRDIQSRMEKLQDLGLEPAQTGSLRLAGNVKTRFAYWDMRKTGAGIVELIEQRAVGLRIGIPEWLVRFGVLTRRFQLIRHPKERT